jgi:hypothetical protein
MSACLGCDKCIRSADKSEPVPDILSIDTDNGGKASLWQIRSGNYNGAKGWSRAAEELGYSKTAALATSFIVLVFLHLVQPAVYFFILNQYHSQMGNALLGLSKVVAVREAIYVLMVMYTLYARPAFLLVNLDASVRFRERIGVKLMYALAPEKFVAIIAGDIGVLPVHTTAFDACAVAALCIGLHNHELPDPLVVIFGLSAASFVGFWVMLLVTKFGHSSPSRAEEQFARQKDAFTPATAAAI